MKQIHEIQRQILKKLQFAEKLHFLEMKPDVDMENNKYDFHLKQLIKQKYVVKVADYYLLSDIGKKYIANFDTHENKIATGAMNVVWMVCTKGVKKNRSLLIYTRKKQPFFGCQGFPAGKIMLGESVVDAAKRELQEEAGLIGEPIIKALLHFRSYSKTTKELVQDKFMYVCHFIEPRGEIVKSYEGDYVWVKETKLFDYLKQPFSNFDHERFVLTLLDYESAELVYKEETVYTDKF